MWRLLWNRNKAKTQKHHLTCLYLGTNCYSMEHHSIATSGKNKVNIFISYSSKDADLMDDLLTQLNVLTIDDKQIEIWQDGLLEPGMQWDAEIKDKLHAAHIVLMLISARFLTTDYIWNIEVQNTLSKQQRGEVSALPVILSPCAWMQTPLAQFQALPKKGKPITEFPNRDVALLEVVNGVQKVIAIWKKKLELV
ncbi:MAG: toll/interleukin-1 receptor domain-containing protein [Flavisolibacter sp.]|nr:toll/interleukin-1 receptor domain-containing protein [Flavisolibacter sp.]